MPHFLQRIVNALLLTTLVAGAVTLGLWMHRGCLVDCGSDPTPELALETITLPRPASPLDHDSVHDPSWEPVTDEHGIDPEPLNALMLDGDFRGARAELMAQAARAAIDGDQQSLGDHLLMLGQVAIAEEDLDDAEVFLNEALDIARAQGDQDAIAHANLHLGRKHLRTRELARSAGEAYDLLLVARNEMDRGLFASAAQKLVEVIDGNLAIRRYGAAASAYRSLGTLYRKRHDYYPAELALVESARLYARSGDWRRAHSLLRELESIAVDQGRIILLRTELAQLFSRFQSDVVQIEQARDYQRLAHHYSASGDLERAWTLRLRASESLARTAKRVLYQRQADVLAVLYDSNHAMDAARAHFDQASRHFASQGREDLAQRSRDLTVGVF